MSNDEETDGLNVTMESINGSLYVPTPQRKVRVYKKTEIVPSNVCFMDLIQLDLIQLDRFIKQVNQIRCCATPGCKGALSAIHVKARGWVVLFLSSMLVTVVLVSGYYLKHHLSTSLVMLQKLALLHRWLL